MLAESVRLVRLVPGAGSPDRLRDWTLKTGGGGDALIVDESEYRRLNGLDLSIVAGRVPILMDSPTGCTRTAAEELRKTVEPAGARPLTIAYVTGDDVSALIADTYGEEKKVFTNLENNLPISVIEDRLETAVAAFDAPVAAAALNAGADIVVTGAMAPSSMAVAACLHRFDWSDDDYDRIAGAAIAGHVGLPIIEVHEDGTAIVEAFPESAETLDVTTLAARAHEMQAPLACAEAAVKTDGLRIEAIAPGRFLIAGATGAAPPPVYRVTVTYRDKDDGSPRQWPCLIERERVQPQFQILEA